MNQLQPGQLDLEQLRFASSPPACFASAAIPRFLAAARGCPHLATCPHLPTALQMRGLFTECIGAAFPEASQGKDLASNAGHKAQESLHHYADATTRYISHKPVQSVLIAAGVGAALALLLAASRKRH